MQLCSPFSSYHVYGPWTPPTPQKKQQQKNRNKKTKENPPLSVCWWEEGRKGNCPFSSVCLSLLRVGTANIFYSVALFSLSLSVNKQKFLILKKSNLLTLLFMVSAFYDLTNLSLIYSHGGLFLYKYILSLQNFALNCNSLGAC